MRNSKEAFRGNLGDLPRNISSNPNDPNFKALLIILSVALFAGSEIVFTIFRKNFGKNGIDLLKLVVASLCFIVVAIVLLNQNKGSFFDPDFGGRQSYLITAIILILLAIFCLIKGLMDNRAAKSSQSNPDYTGDSYLLAFLKENDEITKLFLEPITLIALGSAYCFYNVWGGVIIAFCGVSVWGRLFLDQLHLDNPIQKSINGKSNQSDNITGVS